MRMKQVPVSRNMMKITAFAVVACPLLVAFIIRWWHSSRPKSKNNAGSKNEETLDKALIHQSNDVEHHIENKDVCAIDEAVPVVEDEIVCEVVGNQLTAQPNIKSTATPVQGLDFPFLINSETRDYIDNSDSKVMFIMRGLSGSGKSTIVGVLESTFKGVIVCSADHFFYKENGDYEFNVNNLRSAHEQCQQKAREACQRRTSVVVVDNTNVKRWEMKAYLQMANTYGYVVILVEPKTPWRYDAKELFQRSRHGIPLEVLESKVRDFIDIIPLYYGWFLNQPTSTSLEAIAAQHFKECLNLFPEFKRELLQAQIFSFVHSDSEEDKEMPLNYYTDDGKTSPLLHCTAFFCNRGRVAVSNSYFHQKNVGVALGQIYPLVITGLTMTKRTLGVRVTLNQECLNFFLRPEEEDWKGLEEDSADDDFNFKGGKGKKKKKNKTPKPKKKSHMKGAAADARKRSNLEDNFQGAGPEEYDNISSLLNKVTLGAKDVSHEGTDLEFKECSSINDLYPQLRNSGRGRSAHITLKRAKGVESVATNFDILRICDIENRNNDNDYLPTLLPVQDGKACYYGDGICCVYFPQPLVLDSLFAGHY